jgi:shikimate kinase
MPTDSDNRIQLPKSIVLVGLMGAGKTTIGARLAKRLHLPFLDSDQLIEQKIGYSISYIFDFQGEQYFRQLEHDTILDLLTNHPPHILATGGGAFIQPNIRSIIQSSAISIWLKADLSVLLERVQRRNNRPLLAKGDKRHILEELIATRYPIYAEANITIDSNRLSHRDVVNIIIDAIKPYISPPEEPISTPQPDSQ